jgi:hypothetical protein
MSIRHIQQFLRNATHPFIGTDFATRGTEPGLARERDNPFFMALWIEYGSCERLDSRFMLFLFVLGLLAGQSDEIGEALDHQLGLALVDARRQ